MSKDNTLGGESGSMIDEALKEQVNQLQALVESGDQAGAMALISEMNRDRDDSLYQEVGKLTRSLHEAIRNLQIDSGRTTEDEDLSKIEDATDRLAYVVDMTNKAANKTLDLVEDTMPVASKIRDEAAGLKKEWDRLRRKEMKPAEFRDLTKRMDTFLCGLKADSDKVYGNLSDILLAQDFQDLTGQVINRVTGLVKEVEENLVNLVKMAARVDEITGTVYVAEQQQSGIEGEGPQMKTEQREDVVSGQDDVDDLLSSLGF